MSYFGAILPKKPQTSEQSTRKRVQIIQKTDLKSLAKEQFIQKETASPFFRPQEQDVQKEISSPFNLDPQSQQYKNEKQQFNRKNIFSIQNDNGQSAKPIPIQKLAISQSNFFIQKSETPRTSILYSPSQNIIQQSSPRNAFQLKSQQNMKRNVYGYMVSPDSKSAKNIIQPSNNDNRMFFKKKSQRMSKYIQINQLQTHLQIISGITPREEMENPRGHKSKLIAFKLSKIQLNLNIQSIYCPMNLQILDRRL